MHVRSFALGMLAVAFGGCIGGQSGTESGGGPKFDPRVMVQMVPSGCVCGLAERPALALRGNVVRVDGSYVRLRVRSVLGEGPVEPVLRFAAGDEIGGELAEPQCEPRRALHAGDDVAVLHMPGYQIGNECPEYQTCASDRCDGLRAGDPRINSCDADCRRQTRAQCATHADVALLHGSLLIVHWAPELTLTLPTGDDLRVPASELSQLLDGPACQARVAAATPDAGALPVLPEDEWGDAALPISAAAE
jgi:hypothetical protein